MNLFFTYFDTLTNAFEAYTSGTKILSKYNQAYMESYFDALADYQKQAAEYENSKVLMIQDSCYHQNNYTMNG